MKLVEVTSKIAINNNWVNSYKKYIPKFIEEASTKLTWEEWDKDVFKEYFETAREQCVSSLQQGYFTKEEQRNIKDKWSEIAPLLKIIADNQQIPQWNIYEDVRNNIRNCTNQNRKAATYRLISGLQPNLLCTIVSDDRLKQLFKFIDKHVEESLPKYQNNWFKDSYAVAVFYKENNPSQDSMDLISYPWQTYEYIQNQNNSWGLNENPQDKYESSDMKQYIDILKHKKQIILQGPPGTGKTRLAKEIANEICGINTPFLSNEYINKKLKGLEKVNSSTGRTFYKIIELLKNRCTIQLEAGTTYEIPYKGIVDAFHKKLWEGGQQNNLDPYNAAIAKYLFENKDVKNLIPIQKSTNEIQIIQFHPSYTYEDFVRGISVKSNGSGVVYKTENKILATIAEKALKNYKNALKDDVTYNKETKGEEYFELFKDKILRELEDGDGFLELTKRIGLTDLDEDAFRYNGKNIKWSKLGNRMLFNDIIQAYLDGNKERQDLKNNFNLSGLARQHASYFVRVLNLFQEFLKDEKLSFEDVTIEKEPLKNYVLIIDEINRANLSSVLGELIYALEYRGKSVESMYEMEDGNRKIILPPNLFIIGTMNTADRSVGQIDYAIRRRFAFVDVLPKVLSHAELNTDKKENEPELFFEKEIFLKVQELFKVDQKQNSEYLSEEFEANEVQLGHSYFIHEKENFDLKLEYEIKPILREYVRDGILKSIALKKIEELSS